MDGEQAWRTDEVRAEDIAAWDRYRRHIVDEEDLRLLPLFYWVSAAVTGFVSLYFLLYVGIGLLVVFSPGGSSGSEPPPGWFGWLFVGIGAAGMLVLATVAALKIVTGFSLRARKRRLLCLITAGLSCLEVPYGTLLGVLTFMTLLRPSVQALFEPASGYPDARP